MGKTVITAALTRLLREECHDARAVKPAQTGFPPDDDAGFVADACGDGGTATCTRYLEPALAPRVAAERSDETLEYDPLRRAVERELDATAVSLLEGVGGLRVPLAGDREVIDLVADCVDRAILVSRSGLGTLNHTALSVDLLERRGVDVLGIVCNRYEGATVAERTNPPEMERMTGAPVETVPPVEGEDPAELVDGVIEALSTDFRERLPPGES
ncbi:dethiobiotin synthase [Natrialbaceae archaeon GCM10025810]|uniref:dethiobiotin synthase n=1 Tax=Halovalidus salilacus TaxID=3075124 RepID=UPI0036201709